MKADSGNRTRVSTSAMSCDTTIPYLRLKLLPGIEPEFHPYQGCVIAFILQKRNKNIGNCRIFSHRIRLLYLTGI